MKRNDFPPFALLPFVAGMENVNPFAWHRKPAGFNGSPCPICGAQADRLRAEHRALPFPENSIGGYVKRVKVCFGLDSNTEVIK